MHVLLAERQYELRKRGNAGGGGLLLPPHPKSLARGSELHREIFEKLMRRSSARIAAAHRQPAADLDLPSIVMEFQDAFRGMVSELRSGVSISRITDLEVRPSLLRLDDVDEELHFVVCEGGPHSNHQHVVHSVAARNMGRVRLLVRPLGCFVVEVEDQLWGPFQATTDGDLTTVALGLASVSSALSRRPSSQQQDWDDVVWQGARVCMWRLASQMGCAAAVLAVEAELKLICDEQGVPVPELRICSVDLD
jgi:hypothetical protein